jgi:alkylated DNA repair dioxygenase AlkB
MRIKQELTDQDIVNAFSAQGQEEVDPTSLPTEIPTQAATKQMAGEPKGLKVKDGIYVNQEALTKDEQLELFDYLKPFLEEQAAKTNKGVAASKMIGLGLRWDYKSNNPGKEAMNIPDVINPGNKTKYGYYNTSINNQALALITTRFRELMQKATGVDMTNYDGAIINLYEPTSFISSHNDVDESRSAIGYPVIGINIGGTGNFSIESRDGAPKQLDLKAGAGYVFGVDGVNREVYHRTFAKPQDSFLPELNTKIDGKTYEPGSYRVTVTMRRVMPLKPGMPSKPAIVSAPANKPGEQLGLFGDTIILKDGKDYNKSDINSALLESIGYTPKEIGKILKQIC